MISADRQIHRNRLEREVWRRSGLIVFFLAPQWRRLTNIEIQLEPVMLATSLAVGFGVAVALAACIYCYLTFSSLRAEFCALGPR